MIKHDINNKECVEKENGNFVVAPSKKALVLMAGPIKYQLHPLKRSKHSQPKKRCLLLCMRVSLCVTVCCFCYTYTCI